MLYAFVIVIAILIVPAASTAYAIWYWRSGRYELNRRLDSVTKR